MSYIRTTWVARVGTALNRFLKSNEDSGSVELTADPTGVTTAGTPFTVDNMNKIETGIYDAHVTADANASDIDTIKDGGSLQGLSSGSSPTFASINTGQGAFKIGQNLRTTDPVTFASIDTGNGVNEVYRKTFEQASVSTVTPTIASRSYTLASMLVGESKMVYAIVQSRDGNTASIVLPSGGVYGFTYGDTYASGGSTILSQTSTANENHTYAFIVWRIL